MEKRCNVSFSMTMVDGVGRKEVKSDVNARNHGYVRMGGWMDGWMDGWI
jgi:hypothetical protein